MELLVVKAETLWVVLIYIYLVIVENILFLSQVVEWAAVKNMDHNQFP